MWCDGRGVCEELVRPVRLREGVLGSQQPLRRGPVPLALRVLLEGVTVEILSQNSISDGTKTHFYKALKFTNCDSSHLKWDNS